MELYPFKCDRCTRAFGRGTDLKEHLEDVHKTLERETLSVTEDTAGGFLGSTGLNATKSTAGGFLGCTDCDTVSTCVKCHRKRLWQRGKKRAAAK